MAMRVGMFLTCIIAIFASVAQGRHHVVPSPPSMVPAPKTNLAPVPGPAIQDNCTTLLFNMLPCLDYLTDVENVIRPPKPCCQGFEIVLQSGPDCLCDALAQSHSMGVPLNFTKALALPSTCSSSTTPPTCNLPSSPSPTPSAAPTPSPSQDKPPVLSSTSSPAPAPSTSSSSSSSAKFKTIGLVLGFVVALLY